MRRFSYPIGAVLVLWSLYSCGTPYETGTTDLSGLSGVRGLAPSFSRKLSDFKNKVNDFDKAIEDGNYNRPVRLDPDGGFGGYSSESPFLFDTPGRESMGDNENFDQAFRNLKEIMDYGLVVGNLRMMVTVSGQSGSNQQSINSLLLPKDFTEADLIGKAELLTPPEGFNYVQGVEPEVFCSLAEVKQVDGQLEQISPLLGYLQMADDDRQAGDPYCPIRLNSLDYEATNEDHMELQVITQELPGYEGSRRSIDALANYGFRDGSDYALLYELKFETENASGEKFYIIYTFYYVIIPILLTPPSELSSYRYIGSYEGHEYYLILANTPFRSIKEQARLLQVALGATKAYAMDPNSAGEQNFINGRVPFERIWIGLDDIDEEGIFKPHSGGPAFAARAGTPRASRYQNWYDNSEPNNLGNEDAIHINFGRPGAWNDLSANLSYKVIIEAEFNIQNPN